MNLRVAMTMGIFLAIPSVHSPTPQPTADEIVSQMETMSQERAATPEKISCDRTYTLDYRGFPESKHAEVKVHLLQDGSRKEINILSESGSSVLRAKVLHRIIDTEHDASLGKLHEESLLNSKNYEFNIVNTEQSADGVLYILAVRPRTKSKVAWSGRIWVDGTDYAVIRAEGQPDSMPSWWTTHSDFISTYQKVGSAWVAKQNVSDTHIRFGGHAHLVIESENCSLIGHEHAEVKTP